MSGTEKDDKDLQSRKRADFCASLNDNDDDPRMAPKKGLNDFAAMEAREGETSSQGDHNEAKQQSNLPRAYDGALTESLTEVRNHHDTTADIESNVTPRQVTPGAVAVDGPGSSIVEMRAPMPDSHQADIAMADAVDDAELVVYASSVSPDEKMKMRRRMILMGVLALLLVFALVMGFTWKARKYQGDPRCLLPPDEQDVFAHCSCSKTTNGFHLTVEEVEFYNESQRILLDNGMIKEMPLRDSCSIENQCMLSGANHVRRNTPDELLRWVLNNPYYGIEFYTLCLIYMNFDGPNWERNDNWMETDEICKWFGVSCPFAPVLGLDLSSNGLNGTLMSEIQHMTFLRKCTKQSMCHCRAYKTLMILIFISTY